MDYREPSAHTVPNPFLVPFIDSDAYLDIAFGDNFCACDEGLSTTFDNHYELILASNLEYDFIEWDDGNGSMVSFGLANAPTLFRRHMLCSRKDEDKKPIITIEFEDC